MRVEGREPYYAALTAAKRLAVGSGMDFYACDFPSYRDGYRDERLYKIAVQAGNMSACRAMEGASGVGPHFANGVNMGNLDPMVMRHAVFSHKRERLFVGAYVWVAGAKPSEGVRWFVTSITADAVRFAAYPTGWQQGKPNRLMRLDAEGLAKMFPAPKRAKKEEVAG
jgi:hypothetical protein